MKPSQFRNFCTKFESVLSNQNRAIKKIRWVLQIRPGPFSDWHPHESSSQPFELRGSMVLKVQLLMFMIYTKCCTPSNSYLESCGLSVTFTYKHKKPHMEQSDLFRVKPMLCINHYRNIIYLKNMNVTHLWWWWTNIGINNYIVDPVQV